MDEKKWASSIAGKIREFSYTAGKLTPETDQNRELSA